MSLVPQDLIAHARRLASGLGPGTPSQTDLRRAVSAAYYALFHETLTLCVGQLRVDPPARAIVARNFDHGGFAKVCSFFAGRGTPPAGYLGLISGAQQDLRDSAAAFIKLQDERHSADYDPDRTFTATEVEDLVARAENAIGQLSSSHNRADTQAFLACLLLPPDKFKPR